MKYTHISQDFFGGKDSKFSPIIEFKFEIFYFHFFFIESSDDFSRQEDEDSEYEDEAVKIYLLFFNFFLRTIYEKIKENKF